MTSNLPMPNPAYRSWQLALSVFLGSLLGVATLSGQSRVTYDGAYYGSDGRDYTPSTRYAVPEDQRGNLYNINMVVVTGDSEVVYGLDYWEAYRNEALYEPMSDADVENFRQQLLGDLRDAGYIFATVSVYQMSLQQGFLKLRVHVGETGEVRVLGNDHNSPRQVLDAIGWETGETFNYSALHTNLYGLNARRDIEVQTELSPRDIGGGRRVIDVEFAVEDRFPVFVAWDLTNTGIRETSDWRSRLTAQWLEPFRRNDSLSIEWLSDPTNFSDVNSLTASYVLPLGGGYTFNSFLGYSKSDLDDVLPNDDFDVTGDGYFIGVGLNKTIYEGDTFAVDGAFNWMFQNTSNRVVFGDEIIDNGSVNLSMPRFTLSFRATEEDVFYGRNFFSNSVFFNFAGVAGSSDEVDFDPDPSNNDSRENDAETDGNFAVNRFTFVRFQRIMGHPTDVSNFTAYFKVDWQLSTGAIPSTVQKSIGGHDTVRGYSERAELGDHGYNFTAELRTPILANFIPALTQTEQFLRDNPEYWGQHRLQLVGFYDSGSVTRSLNDQRGNVPRDSQAIRSFGLGVRMNITTHAQLRLDWGYPLVIRRGDVLGPVDQFNPDGTPQIDDNGDPVQRLEKIGERDLDSNRGRIHIGFQLQY